MIKDNNLYVYYEIDIKTQKVSLAKCTFSYAGLPVLPEDLKKNIGYIPRNKMNEIILRVPLKEAMILSSKTGRILFVKRLPLNVEAKLPFTNNPSVEEIINIAIILREAARNLMAELKIHYEVTSSRISIDKRNNNPLAIFTIKKTINKLNKKNKCRLKKLLYKMLYKEYMEIVNGLNNVGPMFKESDEQSLTLKK